MLLEQGPGAAALDQVDRTYNGINTAIDNDVAEQGVAAPAGRPAPVLGGGHSVLRMTKIEGEIRHDTPSRRATRHGIFVPRRVVEGVVKANAALIERAGLKQAQTRPKAR